MLAFFSAVVSCSSPFFYFYVLFCFLRLRANNFSVLGNVRHCYRSEYPKLYEHDHGQISQMR